MIRVLLVFFLSLQDPKPERIADFGFAWMDVKVQSHQDKPAPSRPEEIITVKLPDWFRFANHKESFLVPIVLNPPPQDTTRRYFLQQFRGGLPIGNLRELSEAEFYGGVQQILAYGVRDKPDCDCLQLNEAYRDLIKLLLNHNLVSQKQLKELSESFVASGSAESAFWLDEAAPGIISKPAWESLASRNLQTSYLLTLAKIKASDGSVAELNKIREWLDGKAFNEKLPVIFEMSTVYPFFNFGLAYLALEKRGADLPAISQEQIFYFYDHLFDAENQTSTISRGAYLDHMLINYSTMCLPAPSQKIAEAALTRRMALIDSSAEPQLKTVYKFRDLALSFPKSFAVRYLDFFIEETADIDDIDYLAKSAGGDVTHSQWKKYAQHALSWHLAKENRQGIDRGDYYHMAIEGFRRAIKLGGPPPDEQVIKKLLGEMDDLSVRLRDLIVAHELADKDPKYSYYLEKLEERAECYNQQKTGAFYTTDGRQEWHYDKYGRPLIPFRDAIELAAYLKDGERIRQLSRQIVDYAVKRIAEGKRDDLNWPAFIELNAIYELYRELDFKIGARSLAQHLQEAGFVLPARKFYHLGGIGKEAEEQLYGKYDDAYWQELQKKYNRIISKTPP